MKYYNFTNGIIERQKEPFLINENGSIVLNLTQPLIISLSHSLVNYEYTLDIQKTKILNYVENKYIVIKLNSDGEVIYTYTDNNLEVLEVLPSSFAHIGFVYVSSQNRNYYWNGKSWEKVIISFLGKTGNGIINCSNRGSYSNTYVSSKHIKIFLDKNSKSFRILTSDDYRFASNIEETSVKTIDYSHRLVEMETINSIGYIKAVSFENENIILTNSNEQFKPVYGLTVSQTGENLKIVTEGFIKNSNWDWNFKTYTKLYIDENGDITTDSPDYGAVQSIGYIVDNKTIYVNIGMPILIEEKVFVTPTPTPTPSPSTSGGA